MLTNELWTIAAIWSALVVSIAWICAKFLLRAPRLRAALIFAAAISLPIPFVGMRLPEPARPRLVSIETLPAVSKEVEPIQQTNTAPTKSVTSIAPPAPEVPRSPRPTGRILVAIWIGGAVIGWIYLAISIFKMNRFSRGGKAPTPMVAGFPVARLVLPEDWPSGLDPQEAAAAIAHEQVHIENRHVAGRIALEIARAWLWWLPTAHWMVRTFEQSLEAIADAEALRSCDRRALATALVKIAEFDSAPRLAFAASKRGMDLEGRIKRIMQVKSPGRRSAAIAVSITAVCLAFAFSPSGKASDYPLFGFEKGAVFSRESSTSGSGQNQEAQRVLRAIKMKGETVFEVAKLNAGGAYSYYSVSDSGLMRLPRIQQHGPGFDPSAPEPLIRSAYKIGNAWTWKRPNIVNGVLDRQNPFGANTCTSRIAAKETITTKAGSFETYRVETVERVPNSKLTGKRTDWISLKVGLVKRIEDPGYEKLTVTMSGYDRAGKWPQLPIDRRWAEQDLSDATVTVVDKATFAKISGLTYGEFVNQISKTPKLTFKPGETAYLVAFNFPVIDRMLTGSEEGSPTMTPALESRMTGEAGIANRQAMIRQFQRPQMAPLSRSKGSRMDGFAAIAIEIRDRPEAADSRSFEFSIKTTGIRGTQQPTAVKQKLELKIQKD